MKNALYFICAILFMSCIDDSYTVEGVDSIPASFSNIEYIKGIGGSGDDTPRSIISTSDGGFAVFGFTNSIDQDLSTKNLAVNDYWLLKFDAAGKLQWQKTYGGSRDDKGQAVVQTSDGGYAITGYAQSSDGDASNNEGFHDNWILKLDGSGNILWEKSFGFSGHDHSYDLLETIDGGLFFSGFLDVTSSNGEGATEKSSLAAHGVGEFWGTKVNVAGELEWRKYFGGTNNDRAYAAVHGHDGGYVMAGFTESDDFDISNSKGSYDFWVVKIDKNGALEWEQSFGGTGIDQAQDISKTIDGGYLIVGNTFSEDVQVTTNYGVSDIWVVKIDGVGNLLWQKSFGGSGFDAAHSIKPSKDGGFLVAGNSKSFDGDATQNFGENDFWVFKINQDGQLLWQQSIGGTGLDFAYDVIETSDSSILLVGETSSTDFPMVENKGGQDLVVLKLKANQ
ncbi:hypothetical protein GCM10011414_06110 [Croceivirga lutea]|uniref:hypothetical protein n=1 Tax=Croceivirga lutea TaxID=1775167 RepID=UPI00163B0B87|nr:hypothetical protein [Croceivirga lutea]GGG39504.1 hypothetical protein GCM10011414_06110 [Croceivirga lutea]